MDYYFTIHFSKTRLFLQQHIGDTPDPTTMTRCYIIVISIYKLSSVSIDLTIYDIYTLCDINITLLNYIIYNIIM